jgi:hypothetical protein
MAPHQREIETTARLADPVKDATPEEVGAENPKGRKLDEFLARLDELPLSHLE